MQDKKLLEEYKAENDNLKALKMPSQETEFKHLDNQYKDEVNALKKKLENLQEQIKDQKRIEEQEKPIKWWGLWRKLMIQLKRKFQNCDLKDSRMNGNSVSWETKFE